ncbi:MAG: hypothetical protein CVV16_04545 [Gammaproteobacteria bacterium HGW-Gammaproteobacteria-6]|nr:MAG: hypothetical protein CVV16_04545 [Gammaproteobacteria bacterium HGW-Gammaproteobacteria-6]
MANALSALELELRALQLWELERPSVQRLSSQMPFCMDTLSFSAWLQWVFIPGMGILIERRERMPACQVAPMAEETLRHLGRRQQGLLAVLAQIDQLALKLV